MKIILARHGHAEDKKESLDDKLRELTKKGRKKVKESAGALNEYLDNQTPLIWTSPALRAMQTAKVITEELVIPDISIHNFIYSGGTDEARETLNRLSEDETVILTGHQPTLSDWAEKITGEDYSFKKGQIRVFEVDSKTLKGDLVWSYPDKGDKK